jgi:hypothetical protein
MCQRTYDHHFNQLLADNAPHVASLGPSCISVSYSDNLMYKSHSTATLPGNFGLGYPGRKLPLTCSIIWKSAQIRDDLLAVEIMCVWCQDYIMTLLCLHCQSSVVHRLHNFENAACLVAESAAGCPLSRLAMTLHS